MKKLTFTLLFIAINVLLFGQANKSLADIISKKDQTPHIEFTEYNPIQYKFDSIIYYKDTVTNFVNRKKLYIYDQNKITYTLQDYNTDKDTLENTKRVEYYFGEDVVELPYEYNRFIGQITVNEIPEYYYENCLGDTLGIRYDWDTLAEQWKPLYKVSHQINSEGLCEKSTAYKWDTSSNQYVFTCYVYQIVINGEPDTLTLAFSKDEVSGSLFNYKYTYVFNDLNKPYIINDLLFIKYDIYRTDSMIYDDEGTLTLEYTKWSDTFYYQRLEHAYDKYSRIIKTNQFQRDSIDGPWYLYQTLKYYYSNEPTTQTFQVNDEKQSFIIYPNPAQDYICINDYEGEISITNLLGQVMIQFIVEPKKQIDLRNIPNGWYMVTLSNGNTKRFYKY